MLLEVRRDLRMTGKRGKAVAKHAYTHAHTMRTHLNPTTVLWTARRGTGRGREDSSSGHE